MDIKKKKTIDMLDENSVSILTQEYVNIDGVDTKIGENHRRAYGNTIDGQLELKESEPENVVDSVLKIWGDNKTIENAESEETE